MESFTEEDISRFNNMIIPKRIGLTLDDLNKESIHAENKRKYGWTNRRG